MVTLAGSGLDRTIEQVKAALETQDYKTLASSMTDPWDLAFYRSEGLSLSADKAIQELRKTYLGPGKVFVDLSVDARKLLGDKAIFSPDVTHVVYSTGWGSDQTDDALLLFETDASGQTRWGGMVYIFDALRDYDVPSNRSDTPGDISERPVVTPTIEQIHRHASVRSYRTDPVSVEQVEAIVAAGQRSSTSSNLQMFSVVAVTGKATRERLAGYAATRNTSPRRRSFWPGAPTLPDWIGPASCAGMSRLPGTWRIFYWLQWTRLWRCKMRRWPPS